ncbi:MAG: helicase, partial [Firmicutes bacterium]|nr:helicase [Bacillota bacterium]
PKMEKKLGIVYTPIEIVDFINNSVAAVLEKEFGRKLSDENVHILDPFTGTGTFITRMIQSGLIDKDALPRKYAHELHANEIVLLAYYIASINIENAFHDAMGEETVYQPFNGICLTDTFQLSETEDQNQLYTPKLKQNSERVVAQVNAPIQVIIGNPPYSIGQKSANDDAQNQRYPKLEKCIADTYVRHSKATLSKGAYDSYIKAFRWASDRLDKKYGGIIAFVTNNGWLEKGAADGIRNCFAKEFSSIYVFNLRGAVRGKIGEEAKKEGGNVFDIMTGVSIAILIKKPKHNDKNIIRYIDIGDYLKKDEKLCVITKSNNVSNITLEWINIHPNEHGDWLHHRNTKFNSFICIEPDKKFNIKAISYFSTNAVGISTNRDIWVYNYSKQSLSNNVKNTINFYEMQRQKYALEKHKIGDVDNIFVNNKNKISWSRGLKNNLIQNKAIKYDADANVACMYRPFTKSNLYFSSNIIEMPGIWSKLFPSKNHKNLAICVPGIGDRKGFSAVIVNAPTSLDFFEKTQCFPLFYYEKIQVQQSTLFDSKDEYTRRDGITDFILNRCRDNYGLKVTKEDIFYYVYGLLHSPDYRTQFVADLKKMLPRLPLVDKPDDFWVFSKAGRALADLHLNYEKQPPCAEVKVTGAETGKFQVENIKFPNKTDKSVIEYNAYIKLSNIPLIAYEYVANGRSAIEWIMKQYKVKIDDDSGIKNDPNDWATEHDNPRYILDLLLSVITVSLETRKIVNSLPKLHF